LATAREALKLTTAHS